LQEHSSWSGAVTETNVFKMAAKLKYKRTQITTMRNKFQTLVTFHVSLFEALMDEEE
jgi:hypothetical protein